jgi:PhnB protein
MVKTSTHLHFDGCCRAAFEFYAKALGGKITFAMTWGESPMGKEIAPEWKDKLIHARLEFDEAFLTADDPPSAYYKAPQGMEVLLLFKDVSKAERTYKALAEGAREVRMAFGKTFWSPGFGQFVDRYGTPWMISCES